MSFMSFTDIKSLHVTYYGWHDLPQGLWIFNEYFNSTYNIMAWLLLYNDNYLFFIFAHYNSLW
jgi:hypothetical protein